MAISTIQNFYKETITRAVSLTGATNIYVSALPTPSEGYVVISPSSSSLREIVYYTAKGTDGNGTYLTITLANRGLGGTTAQTHAIGEPVRMNVTAEHIKEISDALDQIVAGGAQDASTITKGISKLSVAPASATEPIAVGDNDVRVPTADPTTLFTLRTEMKFGGTGADGALTISSGTTTIDLGGEQIVTKNYTSISITGTGKLAFSNPHNNGTIIVLKSQGNVTLTSSQAPMIDASGLGALGGGGGTAGSAYSGLRSYSFLSSANLGTGGDALAPAVGVGGAIPSFLVSLINILSSKIPQLTPGGGGGGGASSNLNATGGPGGRGGGALYIECGGNLNFTTTGGISVKGNNGGDHSGSSQDAAGGGGGGGGSAIILYNNLTANSGTIIVSGGTGGTGHASKAGGGGGGALTAGSNGDVTTGGSGGTGFSLISKNTEFI